MKVLVLCTGNRWRSPLLARCFRQLRPEWDVRSAGTKCSRPGADVPASWRSCVPGWVEPHAAKRLTPDDVAWADVVVGVQGSHEAAVRAIQWDANVIIRKIQDPAFRPVAAWPELADVVTVAAGEIVRVIECQA